MSKRNSIIIITITFFLIIGGLIFFYFYSNKQIVGTQSTSTKSGGLFGDTSSEKNTGISSTTAPEGQTNTGAEQKLLQIYKNPVSGAIIFQNKDKNNSIRFIDRSNGNVYEYVINPDTEGSLSRLTNTTIPKVQETVWTSSADRVILRYLDGNTDSIASFSGLIEKPLSSDSSGSLVGTFLTTNIKQLVTNPSGDKAFGLLSKIDGSGAYGLLYTLEKNSKKQIFESPISLWNVSWPKDNIIALTTKPSYSESGYLYFFNNLTGTMEKIIGNIKGLSAIVNSDASYVAYSESLDNDFNLNVFNVKTKTTTNLGLEAFAEKCVWGRANNMTLYCAIPKTVADASYPDDWYQGLISFSDDIWSINIENGSTKLIYQVGVNENSEIDVQNILISPDDKYLTFMNKNDLSLWALKIN